MLQKGFEAGLNKQQISNVFANQEALRVANISPLTAIDTFSGARNGKIKADFYDDCQNIPDPSALDPMQKNLLLLDDCFLGKQNKAETYYTRGKQNNCDTIYIAQNYFRLGGQTVEHVNYPDQATSLLGLGSYSSTYYKGCGLAQDSFPDINTNAADNNTGVYTRQGYLIGNPNPEGSFQCAIPMKHISGFVDDNSKMTYGMRDTLQLIRKDDNDALFRTATAGAGKVVLSKLAWSVPIVQPNDVRKVNI